VSGPASYTVVVLAGGTARRMGGGDKTALDLGAGQSVLGRLVGELDRTVPVVVVGPERALERPVRWTREEPPGAGPVAGLAAGCAALPDSEWVVVLAGDQPFAAAGVPTVLGAAESAAESAADGAADGAVDGALAVDGTGRDQPLLAAYRRTALASALGPLGDDVAGRSMRWLVSRLTLVRVALPDDVLLDVDDADSLARARAVHRQQPEP
jgi:molybdenum cofactor guanylyltransferase